jgi:hypothetical protein
VRCFLQVFRKKVAGRFPHIPTTVLSTYRKLQQSHFLKINVNYILPTTSRSTECAISFRIYDKISGRFSHISATSLSTYRRVEQSHFFEINFNYILPTTPRSPECAISFRISDKCSGCFPHSTGLVRIVKCKGHPFGKSQYIFYQSYHFCI